MVRLTTLYAIDAVSWYYGSKELSSHYVKSMCSISVS